MRGTVAWPSATSPDSNAGMVKDSWLTRPASSLAVGEPLRSSPADADQRNLDALNHRMDRPKT